MFRTLAVAFRKCFIPPFPGKTVKCFIPPIWTRDTPKCFIPPYRFRETQNCCETPFRRWKHFLSVSYYEINNKSPIPISTFYDVGRLTIVPDPPPPLKKTEGWPKFDYEGGTLFSSEEETSWPWWGLNPFQSYARETLCRSVTQQLAGWHNRLLRHTLT